MAQKVGFHSLSLELLFMVVEHFDRPDDVHTVASLNRDFYNIFFDRWLDLKYPELFSQLFGQLSGPPDVTPPTTPYRFPPKVREGELEHLCWIKILKQAFKSDSVSMLRCFGRHRKEIDLTSSLPPSFSQVVGGARGVGYIDYALAVDAPRIVSCLAKLAPQEDHESDDDLDFYESGDYLDFIQLGQVLSGETKGTQEQLDGLLELACSYVLPQTVKLLLARGANPNAYGLAGMNALHCLLVARPKTPDMLPEDVNPSGSWHTDITLNFGRVLKHRTLLSPPCRRFPSRFEGRPWRTRVLTVLKTLLEHGLDVKLPTRGGPEHYCACGCFRKGETALHLLVSTTRFVEFPGELLDSIRLLVEKGLDPHTPNERGSSPIGTAMHGANDEVVLALLDLSSDPEKTRDAIVYFPKGLRAMHVACRYNRYGVLVQLLTHDASMNVTDSMGRTPLHIACRFASISVVSALVHHGASVGLVDSQGNTPLHELLNRPYPESVSTLREFRDVLVCNGADPHVVTPALSPSHQSKRHHRKEIRQLFSAEPTDGLYNWPQRPAFGEMT